MSILPSPPVRLPQEGEAVRRVERESERQGSGHPDLPERQGKHGDAEEEQSPDVEVDVSDEYAAEHSGREAVDSGDPSDPSAPVAPPAPHQIDIEA
jgi:hypothetical protein